MLTRFPPPMQSAALLLAYAVSAALVAMVFASPSSRLVIPLVFTAVLVLMAMCYGAMVGVVGSLLVGLIFAYLLYPPLPSLDVQGGGKNGRGFMPAIYNAKSLGLAPGKNWRDVPAAQRKDR